jgi:FkbM family methyltransferase
MVNTHVLFSALLQRAGADCVCDIGSRDGDDSLRFRNLFPKARVLAFEANHYNYARMAADPRLVEAKIELLPYAVSNADGEATFYVTDVDYSNPEENRGTSSLLSGGEAKLKEQARVETRRLDRLILEKCPEARAIGLWIDVEGAEYVVLEGIEGIRDRVAAIHVETALKPLREGQRTTAELSQLMDRLGFEISARGFEEKHVWGDIVYVRKDLRKKLGWRHGMFKFKARMSSALKVGSIAVFLKKRFPRLYRFAYRLYHRAGV